MAIPQNITREHIKKAIDAIDIDKIPVERNEKYYTLIANGKHLPPKYVISIANKFANGDELKSNAFNAVQAKSFLIKNNFNVVDNRVNLDMNYYPQLINFLEQAKTDNLRWKHFASEFLGTTVRVSFGQGNVARIPWISFLIDPNTTSTGIYPVYLYYRDHNILILAYGISETNKPIYTWPVKNKQTIEEYFIETYSEKPARYGSSFISKVYPVDNLPSAEIINQDLISIIDEYKKVVEEMNSRTTKPIIEDFSVAPFIQHLRTSGLIYSDQLITRFVASLLTKPFVILTGLSGSGKTKLAQAFVQWICEDNDQYCIIPVGADWTNREPLLGYPNALKPDEYVKPDNGALDLIINANNQPDLPHFLILDEMNLSHVERYFADFLSVMESNEEIPLYTGSPLENGVPTTLKIPSNLFIIGTVNIDETTNMFSPKVLDRANTIEFRVSQDEMTTFLDNIQSINMNALTGKGAKMEQSFLKMANFTPQSSKADQHDKHIIQSELIRFFGELKRTGAEFGYRSATEILRLIQQLSVLDNKLTIHQKIDIGIMQKLLPKLHGSRRKLSPVLETLGTFCISGDLKVVKDVFEKTDFDFNSEDVIYPLSLDKIARMYSDALENGFASFAEA